MNAKTYYAIAALGFIALIAFRYMEYKESQAKKVETKELPD